MERIDPTCDTVLLRNGDVICSCAEYGRTMWCQGAQAIYADPNTEVMLHYVNH